MALLRAACTVVLLLLNLAFWASLVIPAGLTKLVTRGTWRRGVTVAAAHLAETWAAWNDRIFDWMLPTVWDVRGVDGIHYDGRYLIISNHVSWVDIFALFRAFRGHTAFIRFFLKAELIWSPFLGQACWALDFPFMRRYTPEYLARHPEKRGSDLATTRKALRRYRRIPVAILNFVEGTRFSREKQVDEDSPYAHLLRPRIGGIAFVLASMGEQLDAMFDVTLAYPGGQVSMWDLVMGRVPRIVIEARRVDVPAEFLGAGITEPGPERDRFRQWMDGLWHEKDARLAVLVTSA